MLTSRANVKGRLQGPAGSATIRVVGLTLGLRAASLPALFITVATGLFMQEG